MVLQEEKKGCSVLVVLEITILVLAATVPTYLGYLTILLTILVTGGTGS